MGVPARVLNAPLEQQARRRSSFLRLEEYNWKMAGMFAPRSSVAFELPNLFMPHAPRKWISQDFTNAVHAEILAAKGG